MNILSDKLDKLDKSLNFAELWIGATDAEHEGIWTWLDGTGIDFPGHWNSKDIERSLESDTQHCMQYGFGDSDGWDDLECSFSLPYVCQIDLANIA